jgi:hypothetical protein
MIYCTSCGSDSPEGAAFCAKCGAKNQLAPADAIQSANPAADLEPANNLNEVSTVQGSGKKSSGKKILIGLVLVSLIAAGAFFAYSYQVNKRIAAEKLATELKDKQEISQFCTKYQKFSDLKYSAGREMSDEYADVTAILEAYPGNESFASIKSAYDDAIIYLVWVELFLSDWDSEALRNTDVIMSGFELTASLFEMNNLDFPNQPVKSSFVEAKLTSACQAFSG